jgi:hypothetical protein
MEIPADCKSTRLLEFNTSPSVTNGDRLPASDLIKHSKWVFDDDSTLVLCVGDSFSHGDGLADIDLFPEYPGHRTFYQDPATLKEKEAWSTLRHSQMITMGQEKVYAEERKLAWPSKLQKLRPDLQVINLSVSGGSSERAIRVATEWALEIKAQLPNKPVSIIIGLSHHTRHELVTCTTNIPVRYNVADTTKTPRPTEYTLLKRLCEYYWDEKCHVSMFIKDISWIISLSKMMNFELNFLYYQQEYRNSRAWEPIYNRYKDVLTDYLPGTRLLILEEFAEDDLTVLYDGHYTSIVHENVAMRFSKLLK